MEGDISVKQPDSDAVSLVGLVGSRADCSLPADLGCS